MIGDAFASPERPVCPKFNSPPRHYIRRRYPPTATAETAARATGTDAVGTGTNWNESDFVLATPPENPAKHDECCHDG